MAACVLIGAGVGGFYLLRRNADPIYQADLFEKKGDWRAAAVELRNALRASPRDPGLHVRLGDLQIYLADPVAAEKEFRIARAVGADRSVVIPKLADALLAQNQNEEVLKQVPATGASAADTAAFTYRRVIAQLGIGDVSAAAASLDTARRVAPDSLMVLLTSARLAAAHDDFAQTDGLIDEVLKRDPNQIDALLMKEQIVTARGDHAAALDLSGRAVAVAPWSAMAHIRHATELLFAGQDDKAKADVDAVLNVQPRFMEAVYLKGILLGRQGRYQEASAALGQLDQLTTRFPPALYYKALIAADLGQAETADNLARRYNALVPKDPEGVRLAARSDMAIHAPGHAITLLTAAVASGMEDAGLYDLLGAAQANVGNTPAALAAFQHALQLSPDNAGILTHLGMAQVQAGNNTEASGTLTRTLEILPTQPLAGEALVSAAIGQNDIPKAEQALARLRAQVGETQQVGLLKGMIEIGRNNLDAARDAFADTLKRFPDSLQAKLDYGRVLVQQGNRVDGMQLMAEILAKDPANVPTLNAYLPLLTQQRSTDRVIAVLGAAHSADPAQVGLTAALSDTLVRSGDPQRAIAIVQAARVDGALPLTLQATLGRAQAAAGLTDDAKSSLRSVVGAAPADVVDRGALIDLLTRNRELEAAKVELRAGLDVAPHDSRFLTNLVELEAQTKGIDAGLKLAGELRADPSHLPFSTLLKGDLLMRLRRYNAAARAYMDEYALEPAVPPLLRSAVALAAAGQGDDAMKMLRNWLDKSPNAPAPLESLAKLEIAAGRLTDARPHLEALLAMVPDDPTALNNLAWTYAQLGDKRARATAQKAYLQGATAEAADTLGWILVQEHEAGAAVPILRQAGSGMPDDPSIKYHLAAALQASSQPAEAIPLLQDALAQSIAFPERAAAQALLNTIPKPTR